MPTEPLLLTFPEAARRLACGRTFLYGLVRRGEIPCVHLGRSARIPAAALDQYVLRLGVRAALQRQAWQLPLWAPPRRRGL
jgi:excisionase family DNA binding protein